MKVSDIIGSLEAVAPLEFQESYDNSGLLTGSRDMEVTGALLALDCTEEVIDEALSLGCNMVVAHHPVIFSGLKRLTGATYVERTIIKAVRNDVAIYACHTNIDNVYSGVNRKIAEKLELKDLRILQKKTGLLYKMITYVPKDHHEKVRQAIFDAGAGHIGNYDHCSFNMEGLGTFRGNEKSDPFVGKPGELVKENEVRVEVIFDAPRRRAVTAALLKAHPYEEPAFDLISLSNPHDTVGSGMVGELKEPVSEDELLQRVKKVFGAPFIKHTARLGRQVRRVAVCGGSGRFLLPDAIRSGADAFITADFKYHEYFDADGKILLIDTGHFESERFTPEIFSDVIKEKFRTFAVHLSKTKTNPVNYF